MASYAPLFVNSNDRRYPALFPSNSFLLVWLFVLAAQLSWLPTFVGTQGHVWDPPMAPFCNSGTLDLWLSTKFYNKYAYPWAKRQLEQQYDYLSSWHLKKLKKHSMLKVESRCHCLQFLAAVWNAELLDSTFFQAIKWCNPSSCNTKKFFQFTYCICNYLAKLRRQQILFKNKGLHSFFLTF